RAPEADRIAYLASEIPSPSATFVYRELLALEALGWKAYPFALRDSGGRGVSSDGLPLKARTQILYGRPFGVLADAFAHVLLDPLATMRVGGLCLRDATTGSNLNLWQRLKLPWQALVGLSLAVKLRSTCVRHLHIHFIHAPSNVGMYAAVAARLPFSIMAHANDLFVERSLCVEKAARAAFLTTISEVNRTELARLGADPSRIRLLPCGVDVRYFAPRKQPAQTGASIVSVGRLVPKKGMDLLLRAFRDVSKRRPELSLRIVGDGPEEGRLRELARDLQIEDRVHFLLALGRRRIREELASASLFVLPCRRDEQGDIDGIPVVLMEAMAMAVPVISTMISGIPEMIRHGEDGILVHPNDVSALADAIESLLSDEAIRSSLGRAGRERIVERHNLETLAERLSDWVREGVTAEQVRRSATGISVRVPVMLELKS
ncbi:MAG TPA: glycosyltransferase, partial [Planctomycetota bacterium]|nr:glycosyltransferase [Planctomycetota bacterium]